MYVFSTDIPFKGSQSLGKMMSKVTAVSYLHSGVIFAQPCHICTAVSMTPLDMSHRCQWLRCARHSGVNDSPVQGGLSPGLNPGFGILRFGLSCDSAVQVKAVSIIPLNFYQNLHRCTAVSMTPLCSHSGVNESTVHVTAVSMTPLCNKLFRFSRRKRL
jgi:hypothetical protein